jgi:hypothetical protein
MKHFAMIAEFERGEMERERIGKTSQRFTKRRRAIRGSQSNIDILMQTNETGHRFPMDVLEISGPHGRKCFSCGWSDVITVGFSIFPGGQIIHVFEKSPHLSHSFCSRKAKNFGVILLCTR